MPTTKLILDALVIWQRSFAFPLNWPDFWHDKLTDLNFWFLGMLLAQVGIVMWVNRQPAKADAQPAADPTAAAAAPKTGCWLERNIFWLLGQAVYGLIWLLVLAGSGVVRLIGYLPRPRGWVDRNVLRPVGSGLRGIGWLLAVVGSAGFQFFFILLPGWCWPCRRLICVACLIVAVYFGFQHFLYWTDQKATFDRSGIPSGWVRLCEYDVNKMLPDPADATTRQDIVKSTNEFSRLIEEPPGKAVHCVIRGGWSVNRTDLAVALGTEFAARRRPVYYFTTIKLLEGESKLDRWKELAKLDGKGTNLTAQHPYFPKCHIIDDVPNPAFFEQRQGLTEKLPLVPTKVVTADTYDPRATMQNILHDFYDNRDTISTIWVLSCEESAAQRWPELLRHHAVLECVDSDERQQPARPDGCAGHPHRSVCRCAPPPPSNAARPP